FADLGRTLMKPVVAGFAALALMAASSLAVAAGNLAAKPVQLKPLVMDRNLAFAPKDYTVQTGRYYQWHIDSKGGEAFILKAPDLWDHVMVEKIVADNLEITPAG